MKEFWYLSLVLLMLGVLAGFSSVLTPSSAIAANLPPRWDFPTTEFVVHENLKLNLEDAFFDPDGDPLAFSVSPGEGVSAGVYGEVLVIFADQSGEVFITASDGKNLVIQKINVHRT